METEDYNIEEEQEWQDIFNSGYTLAQFNPAMLEQLIYENEVERPSLVSALRLGQWQYELDTNKSQVKEFERIREKSKGRDRDFERSW